mmetsp:Transcript_1189/g.4025  ORF Transcript_1189/g.4025 Transcript_1189/m.4025 type:complete len:424 (+) Transcript_1189:168-1439(+)
MALLRLGRALVLLLLPLAARAGAPQVQLKVKNRAGAPVDVYWVSLFKPGDLQRQTTSSIRNASETNINSFETHEFQVKWASGRGPVNEFAQFKMGKHDATVTVFPDDEAGLRVEYRDSFDDAFDSINATVEHCVASLDPAASKDDFVGCVAGGVMAEMDRVQTKVEDTQRYHKALAARIRNYTCSDPSLETTTPESSFTWRYDGHTIRAHKLLDTPHAKIMHLENMVTQTECDMFRTHAAPLLTRATVASEDGTSIVSEARKAKQASYDVSMKPGHTMTLLRQRVFAFTNDQTGYNLQFDGQEGFTVIVYDEGDEYTSHCDGACAGEEFNPGGRVATMVLYCETADEGGGTVFPRSDIFIKPKVGDAAWFAYLGPDGKMDDGLTEHSGCPITAGKKSVTTAWMRLGVSREQPWTRFDPQGVPA